MTEDQFDKILKSKLGEHISEVPGDMWQRIQTEKDKDRKGLVFKWSVVFILFIGATMGYLFLTQQHGNDVNNISNNNTANAKGKTVNDQKNNDGTKHTEFDPAVVTKEDNQRSKNNETNVSLSNSDVYIKQQNDKSFVGNDQRETLPRPFNIEQQSSSADQKINPENSIVKDSTPPYLIVPEQKAAQHAKASNEADEKTGILNEENPFLLDIFFSPDKPFSKTSSTNQQYVQRKDSASSMKLSYTIGMRFGVLIGKHFSLKTGLQYSRINEAFNFTDKNSTREIPVVISRSYTNSTGSSVSYNDTSTFVEAGSQTIANNNSYKSVDVPILVGYETNGDLLKLSFNTGVIINMSTHYSGKTLDASYHPIDVNAANEYKRNTGASLYVGLGVATHLNKQTDLFTEPYIKYRLSNMTSNYQPYTQKINVGGLSLGLRYKF
jgi:opacity protein-like surface antigen